MPAVHGCQNNGTRADILLASHWFHLQSDWVCVRPTCPAESIEETCLFLCHFLIYFVQGYTTKVKCLKWTWSTKSKSSFMSEQSDSCHGAKSCISLNLCWTCSNASMQQVAVNQRQRCRLSFDWKKKVLKGNMHFDQTNPESQKEQIPTN